MKTFLVKNGKIIDGTGNPWYKSDLLIDNGKIKKIAPNIRVDDAEEVIDALNLIISPGFIDIHTHSDLTVLLSRGENVLTQGVTTHVVGNCGFSMVPMNPDKDDKNIDAFRAMLGAGNYKFNYYNLNDYLEGLKQIGIPINIVPFIGHSMLRIYFMGLENREPTSEELENMKYILEEQMKMGAFGMSTGLDYPPGSFAKTNEIIELCKVVNKYNGLYTTHMRAGLRNNGLIKGTKEAIAIAKSGIPVEINHFKAFGFWPGDIKKAVKLIEEAREQNLEITFDVFPHASNHTFLFALIPPWVYLSQQGIDNPRAIDILKKSKTDNDLRNKIYGEIDTIVKSYLNITEREDWKKVYINAPNSEKYNGRNVYQCSIEYNLDPRQVLIEVLIEQKGAVGGTYKSITEEDNLVTLIHPLTMFASDGQVIPENSAIFPNPYANGTFTQVLGKYVREEKLLTLHDAIRRMTSYPAQKLRLKDRGILREGYWADIAVFDADRIIDKATYENPRLYSEGVEFVFVNGVLALKNGEVTGATAGVPIRRP
ncbi:MAG: amidohydrolase family protein [Promethearchaeota archaeon]